MISEKHPRGFIALITVLAILVFALSLTIATTYLSIGGSRAALALSQGAGVLQSTEGCAEDALLHGARDENYAGGTYTYMGATCTVNISKDGVVWTFDVASVRDGFTRSLGVVAARQITVPATFVVKSWREN